ncbi:MAG: BatA domain-containing protein [Planctomycetaceae bacterium]
MGRTMDFANPAGLLGLLSLPVIAGIHLYHRRFPPRLVAGLHLWGSQMRQPTAGRTRERLPVTPSLLLELMAACILTLILAQPRSAGGSTVTHLIAVLDNSASMAAVGTDGISFRDRAVDEIRSRMDAASRGGVVTVILTGRRPVMLAGPAVEWEMTEQALAGWLPAATRHDILPALDMASQLAVDGGDVLFVTDSLPDDKQRIAADIEVLAIGQSLSNVALSAARWTVDRTTLEGRIFARIANLGPLPAEVSVTGRSGAQIVFRSQLQLPAGTSQSVQASIPAGLGRLEIQVESAGDALVIDNRVSLVEPQVRVVRVANQLPENSFSRRSVSRVYEALPDLKIVPSPDADLVVGPASVIPESRSSLWWLGIGMEESAEMKDQFSRVLAGPFLVEKRHPLMEGILLSGVVWAGVRPLPQSGSPLISAGDYWLLSQLDGTQTTAYVLNIDLQQSNLTGSPDWPILLSNLIEQRRSSLPGLRRWNYRLNDNIAFQLYEGTVESEQAAERELTLQSETGSRILTRSPTVEVPRLDTSGVYTVLDGTEPFGEFAVNYFDTEESTLTHLRSGIRPAVRKHENSAMEIHRTGTWLMLFCIPLIILLVLVDWFILAGRKT